MNDKGKKAKDIPPGQEKKDFAPPGQEKKGLSGEGKDSPGQEKKAGFSPIIADIPPKPTEPGNRVIDSSGWKSPGLPKKTKDKKGGSMGWILWLLAVAIVVVLIVWAVSSKKEIAKEAIETGVEAGVEVIQDNYYDTIDTIEEKAPEVIEEVEEVVPEAAEKVGALVGEAQRKFAEAKTAAAERYYEVGKTDGLLPPKVIFEAVPSLPASFTYDTVPENVQTITVILKVNEQGAVVGAIPKYQFSADEQVFADNAIDAAMRTQFSPAYLNNRAVPAQLTYKINYD